MDEPRREVRWFARKMEDELREHDDKGGWGSCTDVYLLRRISDERSELARLLATLELKIRGGGAVTQEEARRVISEAADVANFAMMIADNWKYFAYGSEHEEKE